MGVGKILHFNQEDIKDAAAAIVRGDLVVFPTETVYGLGANAYSDEAIEKIFLTKGRPSDNPLIVHIADVDQLSMVVCNVPDYAKKLYVLWPGPLTLVLQKQDQISVLATAGRQTVGVRIPNHDGARAFLRACGVPLAAPSANISTRPSGTRFEHIIEDFADSKHIFGVFDGGNSEIGIESTVVDCTGDNPVILRPGVITSQMVEEVSGLKVCGLVNDSKAPRAPGMKYKHYSPNAKVHLVLPDDSRLVSLVNSEVIFSVTELVDKNAVIISERSLYADFRSADVRGVSDIFIVDTPELRSREGLYNRILKAVEGV